MIRIFKRHVLLLLIVFGLLLVAVTLAAPRVSPHAEIASTLVRESGLVWFQILDVDRRLSVRWKSPLDDIQNARLMSSNGK